MHIHMLSLQKQSGKTAVYITFTISHQQWQKRILHYNKNVYYCILFACVCTGVLVYLWMNTHTGHMSVCVSVCVFVHILLM